MKSNTYKILFGIAVVVIAALIIRDLFFVPRQAVKTANNKEVGIIDDAFVDAKKLAESVDKNGLVKASFERKAAILGNGDISKLPISQSVLDSLMLDNTDKTIRYQSAIAINATLEAKGLRATKVIDSLKRASYLHQDSVLTARFTPDSLGGVFDITGRIKLLTHNYTKKKNLFAPTRYFTDVLAPDKRFTIDGYKQLTIEQPPGKAKVGFGGTLGYGVQLGANNQLTTGFQATVGLQFRF
ncbi:MAG: hypothetical protein EOO42_01125 [Flavobacteriales bacterium]|nr:MAG: hypothetical protein EOO42_01125 [Flavobacteriales bacterium]